jgi:hypothetical protein
VREFSNGKRCVELGRMKLVYLSEARPESVAFSAQNGQTSLADPSDLTLAEAPFEKSVSNTVPASATA